MALRCCSRPRRAGRNGVLLAHRCPGRCSLHRPRSEILRVHSGNKLVFREAAIGNAHIFRMAYDEATVICDQEFKDACKSAGLRRIRFRDPSKSRY
ncbi:imm11 family protein [Bradyrhizobium ottawaense]|uniref:imm11 family protein n=1 Tax=Bradyrhizobium ottawaense TaxID=931866 RepID=UPI003BEEFC96